MRGGAQRREEGVGRGSSEQPIQDWELAAALPEILIWGAKNGPLFHQGLWGWVLSCTGVSQGCSLVGMFAGASCRRTQTKGGFFCVQETFLGLLSEDHQFCALLAQKSGIA